MPDTVRGLWKTLRHLAELRWAEQERAYQGDKKLANRELLKNFVFIAFLLVLAITVATVLAKGLNHGTRN